VVTEEHEERLQSRSDHDGNDGPLLMAYELVGMGYLSPMGPCSVAHVRFALCITPRACQQRCLKVHPSPGRGDMQFSAKMPEMDHSLYILTSELADEPKRLFCPRIT
jgi:hypothetical protein